MCLTIGDRTCIHCGRYHIEFEDLDKEQVNTDTQIGTFAIPAYCLNCQARMALVYFAEKEQWGVAYAHTMNDEPCYSAECDQCIGNIDPEWISEDEKG